jgi:hypothetical protein
MALWTAAVSTDRFSASVEQAGHEAMRRNRHASEGFAVGGALFYLAGLALLITGGNGIVFGVLSIAAIVFMGVWAFL